MKTEIILKNARLAVPQKQYIEKKILSLEKFLGSKVPEEILEARLVVTGEKSKAKEEAFFATVTINIKGKKNLYAEARAVRAEAAVDELVDKVKAQATKLKSKVETRQIKRTDFSDLMEEMEVDDELGELKIIKRQRFSDDAPISEEQAIKLLEKIAYDFLLFNNSSTGRHSVIYKRKDGFYGIVEPKAPNQNLKVKKSK